MILFFNCRLMGGSRTKPDVNSHYLAPVMYPSKDAQRIVTSQVDVLLGSLASLKSLTFSSVFVNIELGDFASSSSVVSAIVEQFQCDNINLTFSRPDSSRGWRSAVENVVDVALADEPVLVVMNHDFFFNEDLLSIFDHAVGLFKEQVSFSEGNLLAYAHIPEEIAYSGFETHNSGIFFRYCRRSINIGSIYLMSSATLTKFLPTNDGDHLYIGRLLDWEYKRPDFPLTCYVYPASFFDHYDYYSHVMPDYSHLLVEIDSGDADEVAGIKKFYNEWLHLYLFTILNELYDYSQGFSFNKKFFRHVVTQTVGRHFSVCNTISSKYDERDLDRFYRYVWSRQFEIIDLYDNYLKVRRQSLWKRCIKFLVNRRGSSSMLREFQVGDK